MSLLIFVRDDRGKGRSWPPPVPDQPPLPWEAVLYDCPQCGHEHLVTVGECPEDGPRSHHDAPGGE